MDPLKIRKTRSTGPERKIQDQVIAYLKVRDWLVKETHGSEFQYGFPDLYCAHSRYGARWVEVKNPLAYRFTPAQIDFFPKLASVGVGVWIMVAATEEEYKKLFMPANWYSYIKW